MQRREKILAAVVAGLALLLAGYIGYGRVNKWFTTRASTRQALVSQIADKRLREARALEAAERLGEWEHRSLPADRDRARSLYQNWLLGLVDRLKLSQINVDPGRPTAVGADYTRLPFTIRGRGTLEQFTRLIFEFYRTNHLHKLRDVTLKPIEGSTDLDLNLTIEALVLPGADSATALNTEPSERLAAAEIETYLRAIVGRNLFGAYEPPKPIVVKTSPPPPPKPSFDPATQAVLTAVLAVDGQPQAWVRVKTSGQLLKLNGDRMKALGSSPLHGRDTLAKHRVDQPVFTL